MEGARDFELKCERCDLASSGTAKPPPIEPKSVFLSHLVILKKRRKKMGPYLPDPNDTFEPDLHFDSFDCTWTFGPNPFEGADLSLDWPSPPEGVRVVGFPWSDYAGHSCSRHGRISHLKSIKKQNIINCTVFENHRKSLIQHCERSELRLHFEWIKVSQ